VKAQPLPVGALLRYPKPARPAEPYIDGYANFHYATRDERAGSRMPILESGINALAGVDQGRDRRRPAILIRSSPHKAGTSWTPWVDTFDPESGIFTYFGDHKVETPGPFGSTKGNKALWEAWESFITWGEHFRRLAPPLLVFITTPWVDAKGHMRDKGVVVFHGLAVCDSLDEIVATDPTTGIEYPNLRARLRFLDLSADDQCLDWGWINHRKDPALTLGETDSMLPQAWRDWTVNG
jgi:hypothetical protein